MEKLYTREKLEIMAEGDTSFIRLMLETFVSSCREAVIDFREAQSDLDFVVANRTAHKIKPSIDTVVPSLSDLVRAVEVMDSSGDVALINALIVPLGLSLDQIEVDLSQE